MPNLLILDRDYAKTRSYRTETQRAQTYLYLTERFFMPAPTYIGRRLGQKLLIFDRDSVCPNLFMSKPTFISGGDCPKTYIGQRLCPNLHISDGVCAHTYFCWRLQVPKPTYIGRRLPNPTNIGDHAAPIAHVYLNRMKTPCAQTYLYPMKTPCAPTYLYRVKTPCVRVPKPTYIG